MAPLIKLRGKRKGTTGFYLGSLCKRKHRYNSRGKPHSLRYQATGECVQCHRIWYKRYYNRNRHRYSDWQNKNIENHRAANRKYGSKPEVKAKTVEATRKRRSTVVGRLRYKISQHKRRVGGTLRLIPYIASSVVKRFRELGNCCVYCKSVHTTIDHLIPLSGKGYNCLENLVPACGPCNFSKNALHPLVWMKRVGLSKTVINKIKRLIAVYDKRIHEWEEL